MRRLLPVLFVCLLSTIAIAQDNALEQGAAEYAVGDSVMVKETTKRYLTGQRISKWVYKVGHQVQQVGSRFFPNGILIEGIISWLGPDDVEPISKVARRAEAKESQPAEATVNTPREAQEAHQSKPAAPAETKAEAEAAIEKTTESVEPSAYTPSPAAQPEVAETVPDLQPKTSPLGTNLRGVVIAEDGQTPLAGVKITIANQNLSTTTNSNGEFSLVYLDPIDEEVILEADGYVSDIVLVSLTEGQLTDLGELALKQDIRRDMQEEMILNLSETDLNDDEGKSQSMASAMSASQDVFTSTTAFAWSSARYRNRGYDQPSELTYINGISFNTAERGTFSYSSLGGLNDASRNKDVANGIEANDFTFGSIGQATNIQMDATRYAQGWKVGVAATNRNYKGRVTATYASGLLSNGWAFAAQVAARYAPATRLDIIGSGSDYMSLGYFFTAEKRWGTEHRLSLITFGSPTQRGQSAAVTQEVYNLTGTNYYNPYWGYQNGKVRNSREVHSFDPTVIASYEWQIDDKQSLKAGVGLHYSLYSNSALTFFNAPDPRPDYYRNMPSFLYDGQIDNDGYLIEAGGKLTVDMASYDRLTALWQSRDPKATQIDWDALYASNYANNHTNPTGSARYMVERRHNDIAEVAANLLYSNSKFDHLKITAGLELKESQGIHYKTIDDLLGGKQWIDLDPFADRDIKDLASNVGLTQEEIELVRQNDINNIDKVVGTGNKFGYDYSINMLGAKVWAQNEWSWNAADLYYGLQANITEFDRTTRMMNGRAWYLGMKVYQNEAYKYFGPKYKSVENGTALNSYNGYQHIFVDPAFKIGATYRIDGHNKLRVNALAQTTPPLARDAYISARVHDRVVETIYTHDLATNLKDFYAASEKRVSYDLTYEFNYPIIRGRITAFQTHFWGGTELNGYYDDEARTFVNQAMTGIDKVHRGIEAAAAIKLGKYFTLTPVISIGDFHYTSNAYAVTSAENGMSLAKIANTGSVDDNKYELRDSVMIKGLKVATGPQLNTSLKLSFFHPKMWFADLTISYYDWSYLDYSPARRMKGLYTGTRADGTSVNGSYKDLGIVNTDESGNIIFNKDYGYSALNGHGVYYLLDKQEKLTAANPWHRIMIDASVGKLIYLPNRQSLSINLSVSNLTNNTHFKTGGYQQARLPRQTKQRGDDTDNSVIGTNVWKFPAKYYYAWGVNFFLSATYKF